MVHERPLRATNGFLALVVILIVAAFATFSFIMSVQAAEPVATVGWLIAMALAFWGCRGCSW